MAAVLVVARQARHLREGADPAPLEIVAELREGAAAASGRDLKRHLARHQRIPVPHQELFDLRGREILDGETLASRRVVCVRHEDGRDGGPAAVRRRRRMPGELFTSAPLGAVRRRQRISEECGYAGTLDEVRLETRLEPRLYLPGGAYDVYRRRRCCGVPKAGLFGVLFVALAACVVWAVAVYTLPKPEQWFGFERRLQEERRQAEYRAFLEAEGERGGGGGVGGGGGNRGGGGRAGGGRGPKVEL